MTLFTRMAPAVGVTAPALLLFGIVANGATPAVAIPAGAPMVEGVPPYVSCVITVGVRASQLTSSPGCRAPSGKPLVTVEFT